MTFALSVMQPVGGNKDSDRLQACREPRQTLT